jgi:hypothetical protein
MKEREQMIKREYFISFLFSEIGRGLLVFSFEQHCRYDRSAYEGGDGVDRQGTFEARHTGDDITEKGQDTSGKQSGRH